MSRMLFTAVVALLVPALSLADKKKDQRKPMPEVLPVAGYGDSKPSACKTCGGTSAQDATIYPEWLGNAPSARHSNSHGSFGDELCSQLLWDYHECAPHGCIKPIGCGNFWTELKFIFGSCRQYHGTAESTVGHHRNTQMRYETPLR